MRLRQIKLAGFKSFADPALIALERPVVGIVGPNGCGKSNIIDAVRWVLGEARVSELRGSASMKELIFAGSTSRRPLGRASVELALTNEDGRVKGAWGEFAEITVKRIVTAEGQSTYYINQQQVRRRDVQEIFLGTGLGPRSYAIISQGMISNFIKARPEELRVYLEEAAGVSLYRERRKETESLLTQTRANLERVNDMLVVKSEEAARLASEAELARRWQTLTDEKNRAEALWYWIQFDEVRQTVNALDAGIASDEAALEEKKSEASLREAALPALEEKLQGLGARAAAKTEALRAAERLLTQAQAEKRRREERKAEARAALEAAAEAAAAKESALEANAASQAQNEAAQLRLDEEAAGLEENVFGLEEECERLSAAAEEAAQKARAEAAAAGEAKTRSRVAQTRADEAARRAEDVAKRLARLDAARNEMDVPDASRCEALAADYEEALALAEEARAAAEMTAEETEAARAARERANEAYFSALARQKEAAAKLETLEAVQEKAEASGELGAFERAEGLDALAAFADDIQIAPEWVTAVEALLGARARARLLRQLGSAAGYESKRPPAPLVFADGAAEPAEPAQALRIGEQNFLPLADAVSVSSPAAAAAVEDWMRGVYQAADIREALAHRHALPAGASFVTPKGDRVSRAGLEFWAAADPSLSMLSRRQEIERVRTALYDLETSLDSLNDERKRAQQEAERLEAALRLTTQKSREAEAAAAKTALEKKAADAQKAAAEERLRDLARDREEIEAEREEALALAEEAAQAADEAENAEDEAVRRAQSTAETSRRAAEALRVQTDLLTSARHRGEIARARLRELKGAFELLRKSAESLRADLAREKGRAEAANAVLAEKESESEGGDEAGALAALHEAESAARDASQVLEAGRTEVSESARLLRELQGSIMPLTEALGLKRVERQMKESLRAQFSDRLDELGADRQALAEAAAARPQKAQSVRARVLKLISEVAALGPVNHAALEHLAAVEKILETTKKQVEDLEKGIATLEAAIRRIDAETRERMRETFDEVNAHFLETFRELFGGGEAALAMAGDDILSAGVEVHAQPPGKRNASVKLLSGGEQALAATALVFAIFRLNPAPFCLLDEVDAPLDEANQARLAGLCRRMSANTQFLMITHHRVTMEFAGALIGVTMKEPGVSRVVSVDVEDAVKMAG